MTSSLDVLPISIRISFNLFNSFELWQTRHALGLRLWIHLRFGLTIPNLQTSETLVTSLEVLQGDFNIDCLNLWYSMAKPDSSPTQSYSDSHWHGEKIKSSLHRWSAWSTQSDHNLLVRRLPRLPRLPRLWRLPRPWPRPLQIEAYVAGDAARASDAADLMHDMHRASKGQMIQTRELQWTWEHGIQLHPAMSAYVSLCQLCQCRFHDPENKHLTNKKTSTAAPQKTHRLQCHCPKAPARTSSCSRWKPQVGQAQQTSTNRSNRTNVPTCPNMSYFKRFTYSYQTIDGERICRKLVKPCRTSYFLTKKRAEVGEWVIALPYLPYVRSTMWNCFPSSPLHQHSNTNCQNWLEEQIIAFSSGHLEGQNSCPVKPDLEQLREAAGELWLGWKSKSMHTIHHSILFFVFTFWCCKQQTLLHPNLAGK